MDLDGHVVHDLLQHLGGAELQILALGLPPGLNGQAFPIHVQALAIVDERNGIALLNIALQVAEVDGLGLAVGNPKRVPHGIVAQVGNVRDASRDFPAAYDGSIGRGNAEE